MKVKSESESEVAQSCPTLSDPMDYSLPASSIHGIFQARVLEWGPINVKEDQILKYEFPGMGDPGGLPSMGSRRVGHD